MDRNCKDGGFLVCVCEDIPCKELKMFKMPNDIENVFIELNLLKNKSFRCGCYHSPSQNDQCFFNSTGNAFDKYSQFYQTFLPIRNFNAEDSELRISQFLY